MIGTSTVSSKECGAWKISLNLMAAKKMMMMMMMAVTTATDAASVALWENLLKMRGEEWGALKERTVFR